MIESIVKIVTSHYPDVQAVYLFGSYGTADERSDSDVDIALLFDPQQARQNRDLPISACCTALALALKRDIDLINLRKVNTVFQHEIIHEGRIILNQDAYAVDDFEMLVMSFYQKLNEERAGILEEIRHSGRILNV